LMGIRWTTHPRMRSITSASWICAYFTEGLVDSSDSRVLWGKSPVERERNRRERSTVRNVSGEPVSMSLHCNDKWATLGMDGRRMLGVGWCANGGCNRPSQSTRRWPAVKNT
jgi:hypothetical protein